jgi:lipopolysaccharide transport protein LptA
MSKTLLIALLGGLATVSLPAQSAPPASGATNEVVIDARSFERDPKARQLLWSGEVRARDALMELECDVLTLTLNESGSDFEKVIAERAVRIVLKAEHTTATGDRAVYTFATETLELTGHPVVERPEGKLLGDLIVLDRRTGHLWATNRAGRVRMNLKFDALKQPGLLAPKPD